MKIFMNNILDLIKKYNILIFVFLGLLLYFPSLFYDFVFDDVHYIVNNSYLNGRSIVRLWDFFIPNVIINEIYTPLTFIIIYWGIVKLFGLSSFAFHFVNIVFYILSSIVLYCLLKKIIDNYLISFFITVIYILHPCHVECTAWISGIGYNIASFFIFLSFIYFILAFDENKKLNYFYSVIFYILALLSQPIAVTLPVILFLWVYCFRKGRLKESLKYIFGYFPFLCMYLYLYYLIVFKTYRFDNDISYSLLEKISILGNYVLNSFCPVNLMPIYPVPSVLFIIPLVICIIILFVVKKDNIFYFFCCWFIITLFPYSNILFNINIPVTDRYLILPSVSSCVAVVYIYFIFKENILRFIPFIICIFYLIISISYIPTYKNQYSFYNFAYNKNSNHFLTIVGYAYIEFDNKNYKIVSTLADEIIEKYPKFYQGYDLKIKSLILLKDYENAIKFCMKSKDKVDYYNEKYASLDISYLEYIFNIYINLKDYVNANNSLRFIEEKINTCKCDEEYINLLNKNKISLGILYYNSNNFNEARKIFVDSLKTNPNNEEIKQLLINCNKRIKK